MDNPKAAHVAPLGAEGPLATRGQLLLDPNDLFDQNEVRRGSHPDVAMATGSHLLDFMKQAHLDRDSHNRTSRRRKDLTFADLNIPHGTFAFTEVATNEQDQERLEERVASEDSDYDTDLEDEEQGTILDEGPVACYLRACQEMGVVPVSYFLRNISSPDLIMRHRGLGPKGSKALAVPLLMNTCISYLNLEGNQMEAEGARHVTSVLNDNIYITHLSLSYNHLKSRGAAYVCDLLKRNKSITSLELAGNGFDDNDGVVFQDLLLTNNAIKYLNLSDNKFSGEGATMIGQGLAGNTILEDLDLSWNHIRFRGAEGFAEGLKENDRLMRLCLNMNGFSNDGLKALVTALESNNTLVDLDVTNNRIDIEGCKILAKILRQNATIGTLKIGLNAIGYDGAEILLSAIMDNNDSLLHLLDLAGIVVTEDFMRAAKVLSCRRKFEVRVGRVSSAVCLKKGENQWRSLNPLETLLVFMAEKNLRLLDLFKELDKDNSMSVTREEFIQGLQAVESPLSVAHLNDLIDMLDKDGDGEIDLREIMNINNEFRDTKVKAMKIAKARREEKKERRLSDQFKVAATVVIAAQAFQDGIAKGPKDDPKDDNGK